MLLSRRSLSRGPVGLHQIGIIRGPVPLMNNSKCLVERLHDTVSPVSMVELAAHHRTKVWFPVRTRRPVPHLGIGVAICLQVPKDHPSMSLLARSSWHRNRIQWRMPLSETFSSMWAVKRINASIGCTGAFVSRWLRCLCMSMQCMYILRMSIPIPSTLKTSMCIALQTRTHLRADACKSYGFRNPSKFHGFLVSPCRRPSLIPNGMHYSSRSCCAYLKRGRTLLGIRLRLSKSCWIPALRSLRHGELFLPCSSSSARTSISYKRLLASCSLGRTWTSVFDIWRQLAGDAVPALRSSLPDGLSKWLPIWIWPPNVVQARVELAGLTPRIMSPTKHVLLIPGATLSLKQSLELQPDPDMKTTLRIPSPS